MQLCFKAYFIYIWTKGSHTLEFEANAKYTDMKRMSYWKSTFFLFIYIMNCISFYVCFIFWFFFFTLSPSSIRFCSFNYLATWQPLLSQVISFWWHSYHQATCTAAQKQVSAWCGIYIFPKKLASFVAAVFNFRFHICGKTTSESECGVKYALIYEIGLSIEGKVLVIQDRFS